VIRREELRFGGLLIRGRKVVAQFRSGRPLTEGDLRYLHQAHGLPPDLVAELLSWPPSDPGSCLKPMMSLGRAPAHRQAKVSPPEYQTAPLAVCPHDHGERPVASRSALAI